MNSKQWLYIILFCIGICFPTQACVFNTTKKLIYIEVFQDSLQIDESYITPRTFENLKDKYNDDEFIYERTAENSGAWTRFKQWVSNFFRNLFDIQDLGQASKATDIAIKIAGVIIFLLVIYFIFKAVINNEGKWVFGKSSDKNIIPVTDIENNIHVTDFKNLIKSAEKDNNYRLAVRYYYLWLLKKLTHAEIIQYDVEKTNSDYQSEIAQQSTQKEFAYTSYLYNYIWYGEFNVTKPEFEKAKHAFLNFINSVSV